MPIALLIFHVDHPAGSKWTDSDGVIHEKIAWADDQPALGECAVIDYSYDR